MKTTLVAATAPAIPHKSEPRFLTAEEIRDTHFKQVFPSIHAIITNP